MGPASIYRAGAAAAAIFRRGPYGQALAASMVPGRNTSMSQSRTKDATPQRFVPDLPAKGGVAQLYDDANMLRVPS